MSNEPDWDTMAALVTHAWDDGYAESDPSGPNPFRRILREGKGSRAVVEEAIRLSKRRGAWDYLICADLIKEREP